jgi:UPF0716 protein FxsA
VALLILVFIVAPLVELFVVLRVGAAIGALNTIALLVVVSLIGAALVKRQGLAVAGRLRRQMDAGEDPSRSLVDGFLLLVAGVLLILPGFVSDVIGLALLLPPLRAGAARLILRRARIRRSGRIVHITAMRRLDDAIDTQATVEPAGDGAGESRQIPPGRP